MFCPKCGTNNPESGKFCRKCGSDLSVVSDALSGKLSSGDGKSRHSGHRKEKPTWESAMSSLFGGLAFLTISIILGTTGLMGGKAWWFWLLIPAFGGIGVGLAKIIQLRQETSNANFSDSAGQAEEINRKEQGALPSSQTEFVSPEDSGYKTGNLVPPSVVENTTRHLKTDSEGKTMTLPEDRV